MMPRKNQSKSGTVKRPEVKDKSWYVVLIKRRPSEKIAIQAFQKFVFPSRRSIDLFLERNQELKGQFIVKMKGADLKKYNIRISNRTGKLLEINPNLVDKYKYPPERITFQGKKSYRTKLRRQLREKGKPYNENFY